MSGLAVRATLLRPGRSAVRDPSGFPSAAVQVAAEDARELRVVALPGVVPPLALVRWPAADGDDLELLAAELAGGSRAAVALVAATVAIARRAGARRVRCVAPTLDGAARLLGFERDHWEP